MRSYQVIARAKNSILPAGEKVRTIPFGLFRTLKLFVDFSCQTQLFLGLWERETYRFLRSTARQSMHLVDVGAGNGELVIWFLTSGSDKHCVAIEPNEVSMRRLNEHLALNKIDTSRLRLLTEYVSPTGAQLDHLQFPLGETILIKVDVDGAEVEVLKTAETLIKRNRVFFLIEVHSVALEKECKAWLCDRGFQLCVIRNAAWRCLIPEHRPIEHNRWLAAGLAT